MTPAGEMIVAYPGNRGLLNRLMLYLCQASTDPLLTAGPGIDPYLESTLT